MVGPLGEVSLGLRQHLRSVGRELVAQKPKIKICLMLINHMFSIHLYIFAPPPPVSGVVEFYIGPLGLC